jgi:hypothetical protein
MASPADQLDHHVAKAVVDLASLVIQISSMSADPAAAALLAKDHDTFESSRLELGRVLARLPVSQKEAAE